MNWDKFYIEMAKYVADGSKDPQTKVGAVITRPDKSISSIGFNGFPHGVADTIERLNDAEWKNRVILHAEENAIRNAREQLFGYTLYVTPYLPCAHCASWIIASGIKRVVTDMDKDPENKWSKHFEITRELFEEAGVQLDIIGENCKAIVDRESDAYQRLLVAAKEPSVEKATLATGLSDDAFLALMFKA